jgi:VIT1/CCC1 family predicted Fe2+/Mn2+ transporter
MSDVTSGRPWGGIRASLQGSIGDIAFGMEDGAVSIAGLVFGVAASTNDPKVVLLAGATGAAAGAVSMMAGTYLDVQSVRDRAAALRDRARRAIAADPDRHRRTAEARLMGQGFTPEEAATVGAALVRNPVAMLEFVTAYELELGSAPRESPGVHAAWMFAADLFAASIPVIPFAFLPLEQARVVSLVLTTVLLICLGVGRARVAHTGYLMTTLQTLAIAAAAAAAGVAIGHLVTG